MPTIQTFGIINIGNIATAGVQVMGIADRPDREGEPLSRIALAPIQQVCRCGQGDQGPSREAERLLEKAASSEAMPSFKLAAARRTMYRRSGSPAKAKTDRQPSPG